MRKPFLLLIICVLFVCTYAQDGRKYYRVSNSGAYFDNDFLIDPLNLDEDRNYTMGLGFHWENNRMGKLPLFKPLHLLNQVFNAGILNDSLNIHGLLLANGSFTPDELRSKNPIRNDRPYASVTILQTSVSGFVTRVNKPEFSQRRTATFAIGLLGTDISKWTQTNIHTAMNDNNTHPPYNPEGWQHQVSNNGELTFLYTQQNDFLFYKKDKSETDLQSHEWGLQAKYGYKYMLGYHTGFNGIIQFRTGLLNKRNWFTDVNNLTSVNKFAKILNIDLKDSIAKNASFLRDNERRFADFDKPKLLGEIYFFGAARPVFKLYNALLNGQFSKSPVTVNFHDMRHVYLEFDVGIAGTVAYNHSRNAVELKARFSGRSPEFKLPGRPLRWHYWGGLELTFSRIK